MTTKTIDRSFTLPPLGDNPSTDKEGTNPGSFARKGRVGSAYMFASPDTPGMPGVSDITAMDFAAARDTDGKTQLEEARSGIVTPQMKHVATREPHLTAEQIRVEVATGRMIIPANKVHLQYKLEPMAIGRASLTKINANMGASPVSSGTNEEVEKLQWAEKWGADTVMDLSTGGDLDACRQAIIQNSTVPIGTVPIYSMIIGKKIEDLTYADILKDLEKQAKQGVDYFTIHAGVLKEHLPFVRKRLIGIVSRGGSLLAKWMLTHNKQNPMYDIFDDICDIMREYDVSFSLGDGLRPGGLADASDEAQLRELATLGELTERAWAKGVQVMVEGPGHVPFDQIEYNMKLQRKLCHGAPFYVLGPLVTDIFPGYDHITSCIGATSAGYHGASMLCYVTPKEHLGLPKKDDVKQGCVAYKIAAHAADVALGIPGSRDRDDELTKARAALNWQKHFDLSFDPDLARAYHDEDLEVDTDFCAMCGHDWCSVRISKEITDFYSGKADDSQPAKPAMASPGVNAAGAEILKQRGILSPEEIHKLAHKGKKAVCHSDVVAEPETAKLVQINTLKAHGVAVNEVGYNLPGNKGGARGESREWRLRMVAGATIPDPFPPPTDWIATRTAFQVLLTVTDVQGMIKAGIVPENSSMELLHGVLLYVDRADLGDPPLDPREFVRRFDLKGGAAVEGAGHNYVLSGIAELAASVNSPVRHLRTQSACICSETHAPVPDGIVLRGSRLAYPGKHPTAADAYSVIEVADISYEKDSGEKLFGYARAGIPQYIIINLRNRTAEVYSQPDVANGSYPPALIVGEADLLALRVGETETFDIPLVDVLP